MPDYIDTHTHLYFSQYDEDRDAVLNRMEEKNVWGIVVGTTPSTSRQALHLAEGHTYLSAIVGIHPTEAPAAFDEAFFEDLIDTGGVVGVGECGLDYFRDDSEATKKEQRKLFEAQITFADKHKLPLMLHIRPRQGGLDAYEDAISILKGHSRDYSGTSHFFAGNTTTAKEFLDLGFMLSFAGPITFAKEYEDVVAYVPTDRILSETDAPFAAPEPHRGKRNEPIYVRHVVERIAAIKNKDGEVVRKQLVANAKRTFNLDW